MQWEGRLDQEIRPMGSLVYLANLFSRWYVDLRVMKNTEGRKKNMGSKKKAVAFI